MKLVEVISLLPSALAIRCIRLYTSLRPFRMSGHCIYQPTCSEYAVQAIGKYGLFAGIRFAMRRLVRCNAEKFGGGFDPVP